MHIQSAHARRVSLPVLVMLAATPGWIACTAAIIGATLSLGGCTSVPTGGIPVVGQARRSFDDWLSRDRVSQDWANDYEAAERRAKATNTPMAFCFSDTDFTVQNTTLAVLRDEQVSSRLTGYSRATLVRSFEPDRRYAEQFGVTRAPSLILVHRDDTYHAFTGVMNAEALAAFLEVARPPGAAYERNPLIPRSYQYEWITDLDTATQRARDKQMPMVVAYERHLSTDWRNLAPMLASREVGIRVDRYVHCRVRLLPQTGEAFITPFGALRLPAVVVVNTDGSFAPLERPESASAIARLLDQQVRNQSNMPPSTISPMDMPGVMQRIDSNE